jgi:hypothetical protein
MSVILDIDGCKNLTVEEFQILQEKFIKYVIKKKTIDDFDELKVKIFGIYNNNMQNKFH